jgi:hypothetical protein
MKKSYSKIRHIQESNLLLEKRFLNEGSFVATPYTISAVLGGNCDGSIKTYNSTTKETLYYVLKAYGVAVSVLDFPNGNSIKIKKPALIGGGEETFDIPSEGAASTIKNNIGKDVITVNLELGETKLTVKLIKQSNCGTKPTGSTTQKVSKSIQGAVNTTTKVASDATKSIGSYLGF